MRFKSQGILTLAEWGKMLNNGEEIKGKTMQITLIIAPLGSEITKIQRWLEICGLSARHRKYRGSLTL